MFYRKQPQVWNNNVTSKKELNFQLYDESRILVTGTYVTFTEQVKNILKLNSGCYSNYEGDKGWLIPLVLYNTVLSSLRQLDEDTVFKTLPSIIQRMSEPMQNQIKWREDGQQQCIKYESMNVNISQLDPQLFDKLYPYQRDCLSKGIALNCRMLIADEMGVGKTVQSLALASLYRDQWPLLIICPTPLKLIWQDEIIQWLKLSKDDIQIISKSSQAVRLNATIVIISYDLCNKVKEVSYNNIQSIISRQFKIGIADECHYLKSTQAQRSQTCVPILKHCQHVLLLTGTPALSKPKDLFNQLSIIRPDIFNNFKEFGYRYCDPKLSRFTKGMDFDGAANLKELHHILTKYIMIRRLKKDVLKELPEKRRLKLRIQGDSQYTKQIAALLNKVGNTNLLNLMDNTQFTNQNHEQEQDNYQSVLSKCYVLSGQAKINAIKEYLGEMILNNVKFIFFAHHIAVLDAVQEFCQQKNVQYVRMDGTIPQEQRHHNVKQFQEDDNVRIAILGLTASCTGITLTAASAVVFGEMHWTPAMMLQAEDRAHRIGQKSCLDCYYMIGDGTIDQLIYDKLESKINTVSNFIDGVENKLNAIESHCISKQQIEPDIQQQDDLDMDELIEILETSKKLKQTQSQTQTNEKQQEEQEQEIQPQPSQLIPSAKNLKQSLISSYLNSSNRNNNKQVTFMEDPNQYSLIQKVVDRPKDQLLIQQPPLIDFNQGQLKKLSYAYFEQRMKSDSKETEQGQKRQWIDRQSKCRRTEERLGNTKKQG